LPSTIGRKRKYADAELSRVARDRGGAFMRASRKFAIVTPFLLISANGVFAISAGAGSSRHLVSSARAKGRYAVAETSGEAMNPSKIELKVSSSPSSTGLVQLSIGCSKSSGGEKLTKGKSR